MSIEQLNNDLIAALSREDFEAKTPVLGEGNKRSKIVLVGEAPGKHEEMQKKPFVGKAGKNLSEFLTKLNLTREEIYITNVVKIRPIKVSPKGTVSNRTPTKKEVDFFAPFLRREITLINPKIIVTLGNIPLRSITNEKTLTVGAVHGRLIKENIFPLYHPAAIIYKPDLMAVYDEDVLKLKQLLNTLEL